MRGRLAIWALGTLTGCQYVFDVDRKSPAADAATDAAADAPADAPIDPLALLVGCADGTREAFDFTHEPRIAGCAGGWSLPGVTAPRTASCPASGNDSPNPTGTDCSIADLCADGWHVCADRADVRTHLLDATACKWDDGEPMFFASAQPGTYNTCSTLGADDIYGCGSMGVPPDDDSDCDPLARVSGNECSALGVGGWSCKTGHPDNDYLNEARNVTKAEATGGGALCCQDLLPDV